MPHLFDDRKKFPISLIMRLDKEIAQRYELFLPLSNLSECSHLTILVFTYEIVLRCHFTLNVTFVCLLEKILKVKLLVCLEVKKVDVQNKMWDIFFRVVVVKAPKSSPEATKLSSYF